MGKAGRAIVGATLTALSLYFTVSVAVGIVLAKAALQPERRPVDDRAWLLTDAAQTASTPAQNVSITASDGPTLQGWYLRPQVFSGSSVILLHGVADNREGVSGYAIMFLRRGYAVLMPDSRAEGQSGGNITTYGALERDDVQQWGYWLRSRTPNCEYLFGESMGAAIAIQASPKTPDLCAVVAEDPFETFREIAYDRISQFTNIREPLARIVGWPAVESGLLYARIRYAVDLAKANPLQAIVTSHVPTLLITGTADSNIPMRHAIALNHAARDHTALWIVDGAGHTGAMETNPREFELKVIQWFDTHQAPAAK
jgi:uncharacterized protein